jgi:hypothetical protein
MLFNQAVHANHHQFKEKSCCPRKIQILDDGVSTVRRPQFRRGPLVFTVSIELYIYNRPLSLGGSASRVLNPTGGSNLALAAAALSTVKRISGGSSKLSGFTRLPASNPDDSITDTVENEAPVAESARRKSGIPPTTPLCATPTTSTPVSVEPLHVTPAPPPQPITTATSRLGGLRRALGGGAVRCLVTESDEPVVDAVVDEPPPPL